MTKLLLALVLFCNACTCGVMQTDYQWDIWDYGFGLCLILALVLIMWGSDEFWQKWGA